MHLKCESHISESHFDTKHSILINRNNTYEIFIAQYYFIFNSVCLLLVYINDYIVCAVLWCRLKLFVCFYNYLLNLSI